MAEKAHSAPASIETEPLRIRPPRHRIDRRFILWRTINALLWCIGMVGGLILLRAFFDSIRPWLDPVIWLVAAIYVINILVMPTYRYLVHRWETTDEAVYALSGWITREWRIVPISRIQSIDTVKGPVQQLLGLATIKVNTASGEGGITIEGLDTTVADETVRHLNEITQTTPGDAT